MLHARNGEAVITMSKFDETYSDVEGWEWGGGVVGDIPRMQNLPR